jgi:hypothetical protein
MTLRKLMLGTVAASLLAVSLAAAVADEGTETLEQVVEQVRRIAMICADAFPNDRDTQRLCEIRFMQRLKDLSGEK